MDDETTVDQRNTELFFEIADIVQFEPHKYDQGSWGHFKPDADQRMAFQKKYHMFPKSAYNAAGNDDDGRWEALECGTAMCVAGWAASLNKYYPSCSIINVAENGESIKRPKFDWGMVSKNKYLFRRRRTECRDVAEVGAELLGISEQEADILFHGDMEWDANDLREFGKGRSIVNYQDEVCWEED